MVVERNGVPVTRLAPVPRTTPASIRVGSKVGILPRRLTALLPMISNGWELSIGDGGSLALVIDTSALVAKERLSSIPPTRLRVAEDPAVGPAGPLCGAVERRVPYGFAEFGGATAREDRGARARGTVADFTAEIANIGRPFSSRCTRRGG